MARQYNRRVQPAPRATAQPEPQATQTAETLTAERPDPRPEPRPEMRADPRAEDPRARAAARAAQLLENPDQLDDGPDDFFIPNGYVPEGWSYEWKRHTTYGATDPGYEVELVRKGWEPVPASRHPGLMPLGHSGQMIERKGMILMERPAQITERAVANEYHKAVEQVHGKERELGLAAPGQFERNLAKASREFRAPIPIPE